jgi:hypothetical protein
MSTSDAVERAGGKGKFVEVVQAYGDCLWGGLGQRRVPNEGYLGSVVVPLGAGGQAALGSGDEEDEEQRGGAAGELLSEQLAVRGGLLLMGRCSVDGLLVERSTTTAVPCTHVYPCTHVPMLLAVPVCCPLVLAVMLLAGGAAL